MMMTGRISKISTIMMVNVENLGSSSFVEKNQERESIF